MTHINVQMISSVPAIPAEHELIHWAGTSLGEHVDDAEITLRIVDEPESRALNRQWRHVDGPTNVLSFALGDDAGLRPALLGDIVMCAPVIGQEAIEQNKATKAHWAHMVVHGILHLIGYDHIEEDEAKIMEAKEIAHLEKFWFS